MSEEEDFVDFDEDEHAEDVDQQARRLGDLKSNEPATSSATSPQGSSNETGKSITKRLSGKASAFVPQSTPPQTGATATVPVPRGAAAPFRQNSSAPRPPHSAVPVPAIQQQPLPGWQPEYDSMDPSHWQGYWPGGYPAPGWSGMQGTSSWQVPTDTLPSMGWSTAPQFSGPKVSAGTEHQRMEKKKGWSKFVAVDQQQTEALQGDVAAQPTKRAKVLGETNETQISNEGPPSAPSSAENVFTKVAMSQPPAQQHEVEATLVISRIPPSLNHMLKIASYFSRFGEVKAVQVDAAKAKAIVEFASPASALKAFTNPFPVFNNRFILVERLKDHKDDGLPAAVGTRIISEEAGERGADEQTNRGSAKPNEGTTAAPTEMKKMSYRAPATVLAAASAASAVGLYDNLESTRQSDSKVLHAKELQKAAMKVQLQERQYDLTRAKLTALADKMKGVRQKLDELAKQGKNVDATAKAEVLAQMTSLASEIKNAQAAVKAAEGKLRDARKEQSDVLATVSAEKTKPALSEIVKADAVTQPGTGLSDPATGKDEPKQAPTGNPGNISDASTAGPSSDEDVNLPPLAEDAKSLKPEGTRAVSSFKGSSTEAAHEVGTGASSTEDVQTEATTTVASSS